MEPLTWGGLSTTIALALGLGALLVAGCAGLPSLEDRTVSTAFVDTGDTALARSIAGGIAANPGRTGIFVLDVPHDAFAARALLARAAERSLDVQYYIWRNDTTGNLLMEELWNAARRGVRVRLLLDDNGIPGLDDRLVALDSHPNIEVRLFNPFVNRRSRVLGYLGDFSRLNRRMHNKSFTADGQATIVGGRNIGDEYFGAGDGMLFEDLDVLAVGAVVADVSRAFDAYWASDSAYPIGSIVGQADADRVAASEAAFAAVRASPAATRYIDAVGTAPMVKALLDRDLALEWVPAQLVVDDPAKILGKASREDLLINHLQQAVGPIERELDIVSPYFVPGSAGTESLAAVPARGVRLRILTNSLAATDVGAVHAGYAKRRKDLLRHGVRLYELKPDIRAQEERGSRPKAAKGTGSAPGSSSASSLHAKTMAADRSRIFVGSFNLDMRSVGLNTEMGLVMESEALAGRLSGMFDRDVPLAAYEVRLAADGDLEWVERTAGGEVVHRKEPNTGWFKRLGVGFMSLLPIDWML